MDKPVVCRYCGKLFHSRSGLNDHKRRCCGKEFYSTENLTLHRCKIPDLENDTYEIQSAIHQLLIDQTVPLSDTDKYDSCKLYSGNDVVYDNNSRPVNATTVGCSEWVYDTTVFKNTFTKKINLVCDDSMLVSHAQTAFYFGVLVGSIAFGQLSDIIGRKKTLYICLMLLLVSSVSLTFTVEYYSFVVILFIIGTTCLGTWMTAFVIGMEYVGPSKRVWAGCIIHVFGTCGSMYLVLMAYLWRDWQKVELSVGGPCIIYVFLICIVPESPRWLLSNGRREEAMAITKALAEKNGKRLTDVELKALDSESENARGRIWHLFSTKTMAFRTSVICANWFIASMGYYGVILNVGNLGGDFYLNLCLIMAAEYPAKLFSITLMDRIGRKRLYISYMVIGGIACVFTIYPVLKKTETLHWLVVTLAVLGKMGMTGGFETLYVLSSELYPTVVRNVGMGTSSAFARAGSMLAPYIAQSATLIKGDIADAIPLTVFGIANFIGAALCLTLPETLNRKLPDTIAEADNFDRCKIPGLDNDTWDITSQEQEALVKYYIPPSDDYPYDRCHLYSRNGSSLFENGNISNQVKCNEWVYDTSVFTATFTKQCDAFVVIVLSDEQRHNQGRALVDRKLVKACLRAALLFWFFDGLDVANLVCDDALLISHAQTVYYFGVLVGNIILGQLSDIIGRRKSLYAGLMILMLAATCLTFAPEFYSFVVIYFLLGTSSIGSLMCAFVIGMEYVGPSKRNLAGNVIHIFGSTGALYLILMSYLLRDWKKIQLCIGVPCVIYVVYICIMPESPRWLLSNGKRGEAIKIVRKIADRNGKTLTEEAISSLETEKHAARGRLWQLFSTKALALRTCVIFINWFIVSMSYYGVILNVGNLGGNFYLNLFLITVVEYPAKFLTIALLDKLGRKRMYIGYMLLGGIACLGTIYPVVQNDESLHWLLIVSSILGKMCMTGGFEVLYILSSELYPTVVRNVGMGTSSACARAGSMLAPYIAQLADLIDSHIAEALPLTVFGVAAFLGGLLAFTLPETLNKKLPDTIEEADHFDRLKSQEITIKIPRKLRSEYTKL